MISDAALRRFLPASTVALVGDLVRALAWGASFIVWVSALRLYLRFIRLTLADPSNTDFTIFYYTARMVADGLPMYGQSPSKYGVTWAAGHLGNLNPPHFQVLLAPLAWLPYDKALVVWAAVSSTCLVLSFILIVGELGVKFTWTRLAAWGALTLGSAPFITVAGTCEITFVLMLPFTLLWRAWRHGQWARAGAWLGALASIKLFFLVPLVWLALRRNWRAFWCAVAAGGASVALGAIVYGADAYRLWFLTLGTVGWQWMAMNGSWAGFVCRVFAGGGKITPVLSAPSLVQPLSVAGSGIILGVTLLLTRRDSDGLWERDTSLLVLLLAAVLASPLGWVYHLPLAWAPLVAWAGAASDWSTLRRLRKPALAAILGALALLYIPQEGANSAQPSRHCDADARIGVLLRNCHPMADDSRSSADVGSNVMPGAQELGGAIRQRHWPSVAAAAAGVVLYLGLVAALLWLSLAGTGGEFIYAQDDPYIHLAMARTFAEHGVWGVRPYEFASASSSPFWTLLLASLWKLGAHAVWVPFALNICAGVALVGLVAHLAATFAPRPLVVVAVVVLVAPLPTLAFVGMEHTLHGLLVVLFAWQVSEGLAGTRHQWYGPAVIAGLMAATRYESLFLVAAAVTLLLWQRQWRVAITLGAAAALPMILFAWYSVSQGGLILPNSVLMKSGAGRFRTVATGVSSVAADWLSVIDIYLRPAQLALTLAALACLALTPAALLKRRTVPMSLAILFVGTSMLHAALVKVEWFYRYEAYIIVLGVVAVSAMIRVVAWPNGESRARRVPGHPAVVPLVALLALPLAARGVAALTSTSKATVNVFEQQVQVARFFARYYPNRPIAVNDIGAVAWYSTSPILDCAGLASQPVADLRRRGQFDAMALERLALERGIEAAAIYEQFSLPSLPGTWLKVGEWTITGNVAVARTTVAFFATNPDAAARLDSALREMAASLPPGVTVRQSPTLRRSPEPPP